MGDKIKLTNRWCLTEDKARVVPETDPAARWLHWRVGDEVDVEEALRLGAVERKAPPEKKTPTKKQAAPKPKDGW